VSAVQYYSCCAEHGLQCLQEVRAAMPSRVCQLATPLQLYC
jgi:hypothetical protein